MNAGAPPCHLSIWKGRAVCAWGVSESSHVGRCVHEWVHMHKRGLCAHEMSNNST